MTAKTWLILAISIILVAVSGCGPTAGSRYRVEIQPLYYQREDAEAGGPKGRWATLSRDGKMTYIKDCEVKVLASGGDWTKVEVADGENEGAVGWLATSALK